VYEDLSRIYLALPYSGQEEKAFMNANRVAGIMMESGHTVFSPISHSHSIGVRAKDWDFWRKQDLDWLIMCDELVVLKNEGWDESRGVMEEIAFAESHKIPIRYLEPLPPIIGLCATYPHAGKTTLAEGIADAWNYERMAFADPIAWMLEVLCIMRRCEDVPKDENRPELWGKSLRHLKRTLGTEWGRQMVNENIWLDILKDRIADQDSGYFGVVIDDVRFDNEAEYVRKAGGVLVLLERPEAAGEVETNHASDRALTVPPDYRIRVKATPEETLALVERTLLGL
jgi:hypothetical protein